MAQFHIVGVSEFTAAIERSVARQLAATRVAVGKGAHVIEGKIKDELTKSSHAKGTPTPAAPGEPPSLVSGTLRRSVTVKGPMPEGAGFKASVGPTTVYGRIQELGGETGRGHRTHLPPRPSVAPALKESETELNTLFREAWTKW